MNAQTDSGSHNHRSTPPQSSIWWPVTRSGNIALFVLLGVAFLSGLLIKTSSYLGENGFNMPIQNHFRVISPMALFTAAALVGLWYGLVTMFRWLFMGRFSGAQLGWLTIFIIVLLGVLTGCYWQCFAK